MKCMQANNPAKLLFGRFPVLTRLRIGPAEEEKGARKGPRSILRWGENLEAVLCDPFLTGIMSL